MWIILHVRTPAVFPKDSGIFRSVLVCSQNKESDLQTKVLVSSEVLLCE